MCLDYRRRRRRRDGLVKPSESFFSLIPNVLKIDHVIGFKSTTTTTAAASGN